MAFRFFIRSGVVYPVYKVDTIATAVPRERAVLLSPAEGQLLWVLTPALRGWQEGL